MVCWAFLILQKGVLDKQYNTLAFNNMDSLSIIFPTYNEAENIKELILECVKYSTQAGIRNVEAIVVDDNSPDGTAEVVEKIIPDNFKLRLIRRTKDKGLTNSIKDGIAASSYDTVMWLDCDFSHPPSQIPQMVYKIDQGYDAVVNSRYLAGGGEERSGKGGKLQKFLSTLLNRTVRFLLNPNLSDYTSGFIMVRKEVLEKIPLHGDYGEYFIELVYKIVRSKYKICELPYQAPARVHGESKTGSGFLSFAQRGVHYITIAICLRWESIWEIQEYLS